MKRLILILVAALALALLPQQASGESTTLPRCWTDHDGHGLIIGDSHEYFMGCGSPFTRLDTDAWCGRDSLAGLDDLDNRLRPRHDFVVYDLATNDIGITRQQQQAALAWVYNRIGNRALYLLTTRWINRPDRGDYGPINQVIRDFGAQYPSVHVIPWAGTVADSEFGPDGVHLTDAGYQHRAQVIRDATP